MPSRCMNAVDFLTGRHRDPRLYEVTVALAAEMLVLGGLAADAAEGTRKIEDAFASGRAAEIFGRMVAALGGPADFVERPDVHLTPAQVIRPVSAEQTGIVAAIDTRAIGIAVIELGGGRLRAERPDRPRRRLHARSPASARGSVPEMRRSASSMRAMRRAADHATAALRSAYRIADEAPPPGARRV